VIEYFDSIASLREGGRRKADMRIGRLPDQKRRLFHTALGLQDHELKRTTRRKEQLFPARAL